MNLTIEQLILADTMDAYPSYWTWFFDDVVDFDVGEPVAEAPPCCIYCEEPSEWCVCEY